MIGGERHVGNARDRERLAVVERFELREFFQMLFDQIAKLPDHAAALGRRDLRPRAAVKRGAGRLYGAIDVFLVALGDARQDVAGGGIVGGKRLAGGGFHPLAVDENFVRFANERGNILVEQRRGCCGCHILFSFSAIRGLGALVLARSKCHNYSLAGKFKRAILRPEIDVRLRSDYSGIAGFEATEQRKLSLRKAGTNPS